MKTVFKSLKYMQSHNKADMGWYWNICTQWPGHVFAHPTDSWKYVQATLCIYSSIIPYLYNITLLLMITKFFILKWLKTCNYKWHVFDAICTWYNCMFCTRTSQTRYWCLCFCDFCGKVFNLVLYYCLLKPQEDVCFPYALSKLQM